MSYPGGKGHLYQNLINLIPPHHTYIEPFLGGASPQQTPRRPQHRNRKGDALNSFPTETPPDMTMISTTSSDLAMFAAQASV